MDTVSESASARMISDSEVMDVNKCPVSGIQDDSLSNDSHILECPDAKTSDLPMASKQTDEAGAMEISDSESDLKQRHGLTYTRDEETSDCPHYGYRQPTKSVIEDSEQPGCSGVGREVKDSASPMESSIEINTHLQATSSENRHRETMDIDERLNMPCSSGNIWFYSCTELFETPFTCL